MPIARTIVQGRLIEMAWARVPRASQTKMPRRNAHDQQPPTSGADAACPASGSSPATTAATCSVFESVAVALAVHGELPVDEFRCAGIGHADGNRASDHDCRSGEDEHFSRWTEADQFAEDQRTPGQAPKLIGIGKRNAAADADVFCRVLLEQVADDPAESAKETARTAWDGLGATQ